MKSKQAWLQLLFLLMAVILVCVGCGEKAEPEEDSKPDEIEEENWEPEEKLDADAMRLVRTEGTVGVSDGDGQEVVQARNMGLYSGYHVATEEVSRAWIELDQVKLAKMDENSEIGIRKEDKHLTIYLGAGGLYFHVEEPLPDDETMEIRCSNIMVGIRGTCGWVQLTGPKQMQVYLLEGEVECQVTSASETETVTVSAGEMAELEVTEDGEAKVEVLPYAEEYVAPFVMEELEHNKGLTETILEESGLDIMNPSDPVERLAAEYQEIIDGLPLYSAVSDGACFADYIDFEGDGVPELVILGIESVNDRSDDEKGHNVKLTIYGDRQGHSSQYVDQLFSMQFLDRWSEWHISFYQCGGHLYINFYEWGGGTATPHVYSFYTLESGTLSVTDSVYSVREDNWSEELQGWTYRNAIFSLDRGIGWEGGNRNEEITLTDEQYDAILEKYKDETFIIGYYGSGDDSPINVRSRGILPELPPDIQRREAFLDVLNSVRPQFAEFVDITGDGKEDLIFVTEKSFPELSNGSDWKKEFFRVAVWNGSAIEFIDLDQSIREQYFHSNDPCGVYRQKSTGNIYVGYRSGAAGSDWNYFENTSDLIICEHMGEEDESYNPASGLTENEWYARLQEELDEYHAALAEFEPLDEIGYGYSSDTAYTVERVRQQLMENP